MERESGIAAGRLHPERVALLVLHRLRITGLGTEDSVTAATALHPGQVSSSLRLLTEKGWVRSVTGRASGFVITPTGREAHHSLLSSSIYPVRVSGDLYDRFGAVNEQFKAICADWQVRPDGQPNDHSDPGYDRSVLARLWVVHDAVILILRELAESGEHLERYVERLDEAVNRVSNGDRTALLKPLSGSYHDIWMELHQDLRLAMDAAGEQGPAPR